MNVLRHLITGYLIGLANLIPGVSGGTFALILGVYERLIHFLNTINLTAIKQLGCLVFQWLASGCSRKTWQPLISYLRREDYPFITLIALGSLICIVTMSALMKYLLLEHFVNTYAYFFGLIILSIVIPWRMIHRYSPVLVLPLLLGVILTIWVTNSVNPYDKAVNKSTQLETLYLESQGETKSSTPLPKAEPTPLSYVGKYSSGEYITIFIAGVVAISAMVLPGISGSLVLILMNQYFAVISAIANLKALLLDDLLFLFVMGLGIVVGLLSFARLIEYAFKRYHNSTVAFLIGLIIGSLYALWPFKEVKFIPQYYVKEGAEIVLIEQYKVYTNTNILPQDTATTIMAVMMVLAGMASMVFFVRRP